MPSSKITQLPLITQINANTSNTLFVGVDVPTLSTGQLTVHTLAQGLYSNEVLNVGTNQQNLPNTVAQFSSSGESYIQTNLVNTNDGGSADIVVTANTGSDSTYFIDMGYANKNYQPGQEFNNIGTAVNPLDGYIYAQGVSSNYPGGNLIVGSTTSGREVRFVAGGGSSSNVIAKMTANGLYMMNGMAVYFSDGVAQYNAAASLAYTQAAYALANTTSNTVAYQTGVNTSQNTSIQAAFNKANNALANTNGVVTAGDFTISGNISVIGFATTGLVTINAVSYVANTPAVRITGSANNYPQLPLNQGYMLQITGFANTSSRIVNDAFGANTYPAYIGRQGRGSAISPVSTQNGDILLRMSGNGWGNSFSQFGQGRIDIVATENYTDTTKGSQIQFWNTQAGTNTLINIATFNAVDVSFNGHVTPQKGFIYVTNVYPSSQTAITIDFANNSLVRAQTATGLTVTLSNLLAGKEVVAWITNTAGTNQTFTHGVSATNSTLNATSYNIPGTSTILVRYMSIDGTLANTFCSVTHA